VLADLPPRLNWGCGPEPIPGWINSDRLDARGVDLCCDIRDGLPLADATRESLFLEAVR